MKDNLAFAFLLTVVLIGIASSMSPDFADPFARISSRRAVERPAATASEIRHIEPVTMIGRREALADESLASADNADAPPPVKSNPPVQ